MIGAERFCDFTQHHPVLHDLAGTLEDRRESDISALILIQQTPHVPAAA